MTSSITKLRISPGVTPRGDGSTEFTMVTCWDDMDSITAFAGPDPERAVFYPRDEQFLVDRDLTVRHYQVYGSSGLAR